jgi:hypothetical protein
MGIMNWLGIGDDLAKPIDSVSNLYTTDKARIEAEKDYQDIVQKPVLAQASINAILAASTKLFNSGWQPLLGWTCGFLILLYYFPQITIATIIWGRGCFDTGIVSQFPIKPDDILNLVYLLFGFGVHSLVKPKSISK